MLEAEFGFKGGGCMDTLTARRPAQGFSRFYEVASRTITREPLGHGDCVARVSADRAERGYEKRD